MQGKNIKKAEKLLRKLRNRIDILDDQQKSIKYCQRAIIKVKKYLGYDKPKKSPDPCWLSAYFL